MGALLSVKMHVFSLSLGSDRRMKSIWLFPLLLCSLIVLSNMACTLKWMFCLCWIPSQIPPYLSTFTHVTQHTWWEVQALSAFPPISVARKVLHFCRKEVHTSCPHYCSEGRWIWPGRSCGSPTRAWLSRTEQAGMLLCFIWLLFLAFDDTVLNRKYLISQIFCLMCCQLV